MARANPEVTAQMLLSSSVVILSSDGR